MICGNQFRSFASAILRRVGWFATIACALMVTQAHAAGPEVPARAPTAQSARAAVDSGDSTPRKIPRGKFVIRMDYTDGGFCRPLAKELNQFDNRDFATNVSTGFSGVWRGRGCPPSLPDTPRIQRPVWKEIPFDLNLARKVIVGSNRGDRGWAIWLKHTEAARARNEIKMWVIYADLFRDGNTETIVRFDHANDGSMPQCEYFDRYQGITGIRNPDIAERYRGFSFSDNSSLYPVGGDLLYDMKTKTYYFLTWNPFHDSSGWEDPVLGRANVLKSIGGTIGVRASYVDKWGRGIAPSCWIDWVPAIRKR